MDGADREPLEAADEEYRDLASLRELVNDGHNLKCESPEWLEHWDRVEDLTRKIRDWAGRPE
jgi:hypothetical protein